MNEATKSAGSPALDETPGERRNDRRERDAMSPSMRQLILSFADADSDRRWDPDAYVRPKQVT